MDTTFVAVRSGSTECGKLLCPPSPDDVLSSARSLSGLGPNGALIYIIRTRNSDIIDPIFIAAHLDRSHFMPTGDERTIYRAYGDRLTKVNGLPFFPSDQVWAHDKALYPPGEALLIAKAWFNQDRSYPTILTEEKYVGHILIAARTIGVTHLKARLNEETSHIGHATL